MLVVASHHFQLPLDMTFITDHQNSPILSFYPIARRTQCQQIARSQAWKQNTQAIGGQYYLHICAGFNGVCVFCLVNVHELDDAQVIMEEEALKANQIWSECQLIDRYIYLFVPLKFVYNNQAIKLLK